MVGTDGQRKLKVRKARHVEGVFEREKIDKKGLRATENHPKVHTED
jgi:hypothetical protein